MDKSIKPEFLPKLSANQLDVSQFDKMFTSEEVKDTVLPASAQRKINKHADKFANFDN